MPSDVAELIISRVLFDYEVRVRRDSDHPFSVLSQEQRDKLAAQELWGPGDLVGVRLEHLTALGLTLGAAAGLLRDVELHRRANATATTAEDRVADAAERIAVALERNVQLLEEAEARNQERLAPAADEVVEP